MSDVVYFEDFYLKFYQAMNFCSSFEYNDEVAANDFYHLILTDQSLTRKQGMYLKKIILKYKDHLDYDVEEQLKNCTWKNEFRVLDEERKVTLDQEDGIYYINFKFPYSLKAKFDETFKDQSAMYWDRDKRVKKLSLYDNDIIKVLEFSRQHKFVIDSSLLQAEALYDEINEQKEHIEPYVYSKDGLINLKNCSTDTVDFFNKHRQNIFYKDLLLCKKMGLPFKGKLDSSLLNSIFSSNESIIRLQSIVDLFDFFRLFQEHIYIVLDKNQDYLAWTKWFINQADAYTVERKDLKICFRERENKSFNEWVKTQGLGGPIGDEKIFLFLGSPAKWIFKDKKLLSVPVYNSHTNYSHRKGNSLLTSQGLSFILEGNK
jgi:hypothetical protein